MGLQVKPFPISGYSEPDYEVNTLSPRIVPRIYPSYSINKREEQRKKIKNILIKYKETGEGEVFLTNSDWLERSLEVNSVWTNEILNTELNLSPKGNLSFSWKKDKKTIQLKVNPKTKNTIFSITDLTNFDTKNFNIYDLSALDKCVTSKKFNNFFDSFTLLQKTLTSS